MDPALLLASHIVSIGRRCVLSRPRRGSEGWVWNNRLGHTERKKEKKSRTRTSEAAQDKNEGHFWRAENDELRVGEQACSCITAFRSKRCFRSCQMGQA